MHTILLLVVTSGLVVLQKTQGLTANDEPDTDFFEEAMADGFIVSTKGPTKTEKPQDNNNGIITHDSLNPKANLSLFQKDNVPTETIAKIPEDSTELTTENLNKLPKIESATVLITVGSSPTATLSPEENAEGSGIFPELALGKFSRNGLSMGIDGSDGSGMFSETLSEKQDKDIQFITTVGNSGDLKIATLSSEDNGESGMGPTAPTTMPTIGVDEAVIVKTINNVALEKPMEESSPEPAEKVSSQSKSRHFEEFAHESDAQVKEGTPGWLLILALCLTLGAVICVFVGIATKDMWYGPSKRCLNINSINESKKHEEYNKAATLPLSEKEMVALVGSQKTERKETDYTIISLEEVPEKEYLM